ncbi:hypothetical protein AYO41_00705 [Verrucomicrobia bacterium SCGC AG-212-E04]|nr:hypothetical protein AYO41_00705 [Verrucomicrobia bacterium SCGC AG-212-E04]
MILTTFLHGDSLFWLLAVAGPVIGFLILRLGRSTESVVATPIQPAQPSPIEPDSCPVPTQRVGIPSTALVRVHEACGGHIKDGELDIRFELRSRRDCDKMLEVIKTIKENLQCTKTVFSNAEAEILAQLNGPAAVAGRNTARVSGMSGRSTAEREHFKTAKLAELDGYDKASRLIDKFLMELSSAELSLQELPFYTAPEPRPAHLLPAQS